MQIPGSFINLKLNRHTLALPNFAIKSCRQKTCIEALPRLILSMNSR